MFIIEYFDPATHRWRPMPADAWSEQATQYANTADADRALVRYQRRSPSCRLRVAVAATVHA